MAIRSLSSTVPHLPCHLTRNVYAEVNLLPPHRAKQQYLAASLCAPLRCKRKRGEAGAFTWPAHLSPSSFAAFLSSEGAEGFCPAFTQLDSLPPPNYKTTLHHARRSRSAHNYRLPFIALPHHLDTT
ncbi:hypothetical protein TRVL_07108 [Trypanosoma vivax]|uniref:Uncharacterized protein n=1 Tax=Trypanosoma vivax (strain Y486) TaxID=1055687 RepID=G0TV30_TRYVY|nr:hypothetical protein TRVL_07108 [Trypanosoma vivax]CCC47795.1 hypothetical protein, unlikely [Trypanosoma vivax Y486]